MLKQYVLSIIGNDKPGLVESLAATVKEHNGNWLESRMANLAGKFSGIVLVSVAATKAEDFEQAVEELKNLGLSVRATPTEAIAETGRHNSQISLVANDRPGILNELSSVLANLTVNVEELTTDCSPAPMSGDLLFNAKLKVSIPDSLNDADLRTAIEGLADDLMVEIDRQ